MTAFNIFKKSNKPAPKKDASKKREVVAPVVEEVKKPVQVSVPTGISTLRSFRVSEKSSRLLEMNQYTFNVTKASNKKEIKKQIEQRYQVTVAKIRIQNMPSKKRTVGRYQGTRSGFKKAIVTLAEGSTIEHMKQ